MGFIVGALNGLAVSIQNAIFKKLKTTDPIIINWFRFGFGAVALAILVPIFNYWSMPSWQVIAFAARTFPEPILCQSISTFAAIARRAIIFPDGNTFSSAWLCRKSRNSIATWLYRNYVRGNWTVYSGNADFDESIYFIQECFQTKRQSVYADSLFLLGARRHAHKICLQLRLATCLCFLCNLFSFYFSFASTSVSKNKSHAFSQGVARRIAFSVWNNLQYLNRSSLHRSFAPYFRLLHFYKTPKHGFRRLFRLLYVQ